METRTLPYYLYQSMFLKSKKGLEDLLQLGNPLLYQTCEPVLESEMDRVPKWSEDLRSVMHAIRKKYKFGRAIAAPQLGIMKRLIYMDVDTPTVIINPEIDQLSEEMFELWDDCMSFPNLLVRVRRHRSLRLRYRDLNWQWQECQLQDDLSELIQHEYDHLEGILCTQRAIDSKSLKWRPTPL